MNGHPASSSCSSHHIFAFSFLKSNLFLLFLFIFGFPLFLLPLWDKHVCGGGAEFFLFASMVFKLAQL